MSPVNFSQIRVTPKTRKPFTIKALSISGVTWNWHVLNHASKITEEAVAVLTTAGIRVGPVRLVRRMDLVSGLPAGQAAVEWHPSGKASLETQELWQWVRQHAGLPVVPQEAK